MSAESSAAPAVPPLRPTPFEWGAMAALLLAFAPALLAMAEVWGRLDYYSHGYLIPLVALWAATARRDRLPELRRERDPRGLWLLFGALVLYVLGLVAAVVFFQGLALVGAVAGALLFLRGAAWVRALAFPVGFLLFMVPLPESWLRPLIVQLQLQVSAAAVGLLRLAGAGVTRNGNVIELPDGQTLFVAEACSGITSVVTLLPLAVFLAYFTERTWARRSVIIAAVVPLAMAGNLLRVTATVVATQAWGAEVATASWVHETAGLLTYVLGCLALLGVGALLRWLAPPRT